MSLKFAAKNRSPNRTADDPLNRSFGDREQKADTGENLQIRFQR